MNAQGTGVYVILHSCSRWHLLFQSFSFTTSEKGEGTSHKKYRLLDSLINLRTVRTLGLN